MILIGNDIVDLKDIDSYPPSENERFLDRVFRDEEKNYIFSSSDPKKTLWTLWAVKESAYKAWKRKYPKLIFSPKSFKIDIKKQKIIHHNYGRLSYRIEDGGGDWIAVYAFKPRLEKNLKFMHWIGEVSKLSRGNYNSSFAVRRLVAEKLSELWKEPEDTITVTKDIPPQVTSQQSGKVQPISLSHHGRYVAAFVAIA